MLSENLKAVLDNRLWGTAEKVINHYKSKGYKISELVGIDKTVRYKPHIVCKKRYETIAIEIREKCSIQPIEKFVIGCNAGRIPVKIYYAIPEILDDSETTLTHTQRFDMKELGLGLITVREVDIVIDLNTISCNRRFVLEPGPSLGKHAKKIDDIIRKYNLGNCLDAVRDLSEEAEDATFSLGLKASKKGKINLTVSDINQNKATWEDLINIFSTTMYKSVSQTKIIEDTKLKNSLINVKDKRNLSDHKKTAKQKRELEEQFPEAMMQGIRVIRELVKLNSNLK